MSWLVFPVRNLSRGNTQPENMCDIVFEKTKGFGGTINFIKRETSTQVFPCETTLFCRISAIGRFLNTKAGVSLWQGCKPDDLKAVIVIRKMLYHRYFSANFAKFSGKLFWRTPPRNNSWHDVVFLPFCRSVGLKAACSLKTIYLVEQCINGW